MVIKYEGETEYSNGGKKIVSNMSNMVILPKGSSYDWKCTKAGHYCCIEFDADGGCPDIFGFKIKQGEKMLKMFKSLEYKRLSRSPLYEMECISGAYEIILGLLSQRSEGYTPRQKEQKLIPAFEYISKNYNKEIQNEDLASLTGLSTVYFRKLFSEVYGISPIAYVKNLRIKKAKEMLYSDYGSITDIAFSLGYSNIYDFSRDFKKHVGVSPSRYISKKQP